MILNVNVWSMLHLSMLSEIKTRLPCVLTPRNISYVDVVLLWRAGLINCLKSRQQKRNQAVHDNVSASHPQKYTCLTWDLVCKSAGVLIWYSKIHKSVPLPAIWKDWKFKCSLWKCPSRSGSWVNFIHVNEEIAIIWRE